MKVSQELDVLAENGNWKELREEAQKQLDAISPDDDWAGVFWNHFCLGLRKSDEIEQYDAMFEKYAAGKFAGNVAFFAYSPSWAHKIPKFGSLIGNVFKRGDPDWENMGRRVESAYRDRARLLSLMVPLISKAQEQRNRTNCQHFFCVLAQVLLRYHDRGHSYKLQELTDLDNLPDYNNEEEFYASSSRPPVNPDDSPVFYRLPESWDKAANDGERLRFAVEQANCNDAKRLWADFLCEQFDFLAADASLRQEYYKTPAMMQSLYDLKDNESIAVLADNVRRITLPDEFNYMEMYRNLNDHLKLGQIYASRMQFEKAAAEFEKDTSSNAQQYVAHIRGSWGEPDSSYITLAGKDFTVPYHFRNAKTVTVKLYRVDMAKTIERWLDNLKNAESKYFSPCDFALIRNKENSGEAWKDLIAKEPFIVKRFDLAPLPHHWEKTTQLHFGNLEPGAFVAEFVPDDNQESRVDSMIWIADRALTTLTCSCNDRIRLFINDPVTGRPCPDVTIKIHSFYHIYDSDAENEILSEVLTYKTDGNGIAEFSKTDFKKPKESSLAARVILAETSPEKLTMLKCDDFQCGNADSAAFHENMRNFIITDKTVYKPGDAIAFTGYLRQPSYSGNFKPYPKETITLVFMDPQYNEAFQKEVPFDEKTQSFTFEMKLPADAMLGRWQVFVDKDFDEGVDFLVAEYKKPEYLLTVTPPAKPVKAGEKMPVTIEAKYYFGAPMPDAEVSYKVFREETQPVMPFAFEWNWLDETYALCTTFLKKGGVEDIAHDREIILNTKGKTDAQGKLTFEIDSAAAVEKYGEKDFRYTIKAEVMDATNRLVSGSGSVIAAVKPFHIFLYAPWGFAKTGERQQLQVAARTPNGEKVNGMGTLRIFRKGIGNAPKDGRTTSGLPERVGAALKTIHFTPDGPDNPEFILNEEGMYEVEVEVLSEDGVSVSQSVPFFVVGEKQGESLFGEYPISISKDKPTYQPGETAQILVTCDKPGRTIYFFTRSERDARIQCVTLSGYAKLFPVPIEKEDQPNFFVSVMSYQDGELAMLTQEILVPPEKKRLQVTAKPSAEKVEPGSTLPLTITVSDLEGKPVSGNVTIAVYDKSLEAINDDCTILPILPFFWSWKRWFINFPDGFFRRMPRMWKPLTEMRRDVDFQYLFGFHSSGMSRDASEDGDEVDAPMPEPIMMAMGACDSYRGLSDNAYGASFEEAEDDALALGAYAGEKRDDANTFRKNFLDRAFWAGRLDLPESGEITVNVPVPDNLTTWVVRAWSLTPDTRVGEARTEIVVSKDLIARLELPRFMIQGDVVNAVVSLNNTTSDDLGEVSSSLAAPGLLEAAQTQTVMLQANGMASYEVPLQANEAGEHTLALSAKAIDASDALELGLTVLPKGMDKQVNSCGRLDATRTTASITLDIPEERRPETTAFALYLSPGAAKNMVEILPYLAADDSGDVFGIVNHFLPAISVKTALNDLCVKWEDAISEPTSRAPLYAEYLQHTSGVPSFSAEDLDRVVAKNLRQIAKMVNSDGGWGWFGAYHESSWPDTTAYVVDALLDVRDKFDARLIDGGVSWLENYAKERIAKFKDSQAIFNTDALIARVLAKAGKPNPELMKLCYDHRVKCLAPYGYTMLALAYDQETDEAKMLMRNLEQFLKVDNENDTAYLSIPQQCSFFWFGDANETLAAYLELLLRNDPQSVTARKVANYLGTNVRNSPWHNSTRSLGAAVKALAKYIVASGEDKPDFTVTVRDGEMEHKYVFNTQNLWKNDGPAFFLPSDKLASGKRTIELEFSGTGALYWNGMLSYFTLEDEIKPAGLEMKIQRNYYRLVEDPNASALLAGKNGAAVKADMLKYKRIPLADGDSVKPGDLVEVELISTSKNDYDYVVLQDAMPAGFEYENPISGWKWDWAAPMYVEYKERGAKFYLRNMARGQSNAFYRIRAQLCGTVTALPAKGYGIYAPELKCNGEQQTLNTKK